MPRENSMPMTSHRKRIFGPDMLTPLRAATWFTYYHALYPRDRAKNGLQTAVLLNDRSMTCVEMDYMETLIKVNAWAGLMRSTII